MKSCKKFTALVFSIILFFLWATPCPALDDARFVIDPLIVRPLGVGSTLVGTAVFIVALPFTIPARSVGKAADKLIMAPARFTFTRPLGDFEKDRNGDLRGLAFTQDLNSKGSFDDGQP